MAHSRQPKEIRQGELTDAALHIIATRGIAALNTRSLASAVGLSSGAIFRHFASLDALLDAVVTRAESVLESTYPAATLPPLERLEQFIVARSSAVGNQLGILRLVLSEQFLLALPEGASKRLAACVRKTRAFVLASLREAQDDGTCRADLPAETLAPIVMGTAQMLALSRQQADRREAETRAVVCSLFTLLRPPPLPSAPAPSPTRKRSA